MLSLIIFIVDAKLPAIVPLHSSVNYRVVGLSPVVLCLAFLTLSVCSEKSLENKLIRLQSFVLRAARFI